MVLWTGDFKTLGPKFVLKVHCSRQMPEVYVYVRIDSVIKVGNIIVTNLENTWPCLHINIVDTDTTFHVCLQRCRYAHGWLPNSLITPTNTLLGPLLAYRLILAWLHRPSLPSWYTHDAVFRHLISFSEIVADDADFEFGNLSGPIPKTCMNPATLTQFSLNLAQKCAAVTS